MQSLIEQMSNSDSYGRAVRRALIPVIVIGTAAATLGGAALSPTEVTRAAEAPTRAGFADFSKIVDAVKPSVIAINAATYWYALRSNGIKDRMPGWGSLFLEH